MWLDLGQGKEVGDTVVQAGLGQGAGPCQHRGDFESYSEGGGNSLGAEIGAEEGHALKCFSRITLAAVLKTDTCLREGRGQGQKQMSLATAQE